MSLSSGNVGDKQLRKDHNNIFKFKAITEENIELNFQGEILSLMLQLFRLVKPEFLANAR